MNENDGSTAKPANMKTPAESHAKTVALRLHLSRKRMYQYWRKNHELLRAPWIERALDEQFAMVWDMQVLANHADEK